MSRNYFHVEEKRIHTELLLLKSLINEQYVYEEPCPLLLSQLNNLKVLLTFLQGRIDTLAHYVEEALKEA